MTTNENNKVEEYTVKLKVNNYITVDLTLQSEMDLSEFHALTDSVKKFSTIPSPQKTQKKKYKQKGANDTRKKGPWMPTEIEVLHAEFDKSMSIHANAKQIASKNLLNRGRKQIYNKIKNTQERYPKQFKERFEGK